MPKVEVNESAYDAWRKRTCEWCAKGYARENPHGDVYVHWIPLSDRSGPDYAKCTAPSLADFAEQQAARVRELEVDLRDRLTGQRVSNKIPYTPAKNTGSGVVDA